MATAVMSSKGQIVIPAGLRRQAELAAGDRVEISFDEATQELRLHKAEPIDHLVDQLASTVAAWIKPGTPPLDDARAFYRTREAKH